jgi:hypothetical protein
MQTFVIAPASVKSFWLLLLVVGIPLVLVSVVLAGLIAGSRGARFEVSSASLRLRGDLYGRTIALSDLRGGSARRIDIGADSEIQPVRRTLGTGLPGYRAGWFRLRNGQKALLYVTDPTKVVYLPTRLDYSIKVSPDNPDGFLSAIKTAALES